MFPVNLFIVQLFIRVKQKSGKEQKNIQDSAGNQQSYPSYKDRHKAFYSMLYGSKTFEKSKSYIEICSKFPDEERDKNGSIIMELYLKTFAKTMFLNSLKGLSQEEFVARLKQTETVSLKQESPEQSGLVCLPEKSNLLLPSEDETIEKNSNMSNCTIPRRKRNSNKARPLESSSSLSSSSSQDTEQNQVLKRKEVKKM